MAVVLVSGLTLYSRGWWIAVCLISALIHFTHGAVFYLSNGTSILRFDSHSKDVGVIYTKPQSQIVGLAVDIADNILFWSDVGANHRGLYTATLDGQNPRLLMADIQEVSSLSVDWSSNHIYWTDAKRKTVEIANYDGSGRKILVSLSTKEDPRGIMVDPILGYLYWADPWNVRIERTKLNGTDREVLVKQGVYSPNQLALSRIFRKLYWVEASGGIMSCGLDGTGLKRERDLFNITSGNPSFGLVVIGNKAFVSTWNNNAIYSTLVGTPMSRLSREVTNLGTDKLYSLASLDQRSTQPLYEHPCGQRDRGGCSHLCLPSGWGTSFDCHCPSFSGLALDSERTTCSDPDELMLYTFQDYGEVGFTNPTRSSDILQTNIIGQSHSPICITYDPIHQVVYWTNREGPSAIYRSTLRGENKEEFLTEKDGLGYIDGLALDWIGQYLYYTNSGRSKTFAGSVFPWKRVEMISLDGRVRRTVVSDVRQPRKIAVDHHKGFLYVVDGGDEPRLLRTNLDGSQPTTVIDGLTNPLAVSVYGNMVYLADGTASKDSSALIAYNAVNGSVSTLMKMSSNILDITCSPTAVYVSTYDDQQNKGHMYVVDLETMKKDELYFQGRVATGLFYSKRIRVLGPHDDHCKGAPCSHTCIRVTNQSPSYNCICPDGTAMMMTNDGATCLRPENFMLVADQNLIQMLNLDPHPDPRAHTLHYGHAHSNFLSVIYESSTSTIYWIDGAKILAMGLDDQSGPTVLNDRGQFALGSLALDEDNRRLYWSWYDQSQHGRIMKMKLRLGAKSTKSVVTINRAVTPRTILLHTIATRKWIFWTEYLDRYVSSDDGSHEGSIHRAHTNGMHHHILIKQGLMWPSTLAIYDNRLYAASMDGKLLSMDLDGSNIEELYVFEPFVVGVYEMTFLSNYLLVTNLERRSVDLLDIETGWNVTLASHFSRPTSLTYFHPTDLTENGECRTEKNRCSNNCVSIPGSLYCTCPERHSLGADAHTCVEVENPWEAVKDMNCLDQCGENVECARLIPTITFQCLCSPGHQPHLSDCKACPVNMYKGMVENYTCSTCELGTTTHGQTGGTSCSCRNHLPPPPNQNCDDSEEVVTAPPPIRPQPDPTYKVWPKGRGSDKPGEEQMLGDPRFTNKWTLIANKKGSRNRGSPYFENCPFGDTLTVQIPSTKNKASIPVTWSAHDYTGREIPYTTNYQEVNGQLVVEWLANGPDGKHTVVMDASDSTGQITVCTFYVLVQDKTLCEFPATEHGAFACSLDPNTHVEACQVVCDELFAVNPLDLFRRSYSCDDPDILQNLKDILQHQQACLSLLVPSVVTQKFTMWFKGPCESDDPDLADELYLSVIQDLKAHTPSNTCHFSNLSIECDFDSSIHRSRRSYMESQLFVVKWNVTIDNGFLNYWADSSIHRSRRSYMESQLFIVKWNVTIDNGFLNYWADSSIHRSRRSYMESQLFVVKWNVTIDNGFLNYWADSSIHRSRRSYMESQLFVVKWNVTIDNGTGLRDGQVEIIFRDIKLELMRLLPDIRLHVDKHEYMAVRKVATSELIWSCRPGELWNNDGCVACPPGSRYVGEPDHCHTCTPGSYQPYDRQEDCFPCQDDLNSNPGATSAEQCFEVTALDQMSKFIIITACTFGFVFLVMAIILYFQHKRQQKNTRANRGLTAADTQKYVTPNLYVASPPIPRPSPECSHRTISISKPMLTPDTKSPLQQTNLYSNHDYDDMPYTSTLSSLHNGSARTVYQNDFTNMSPPGSPRMMGSHMATDRGLGSPMTDRGVGSPMADRDLVSPVTDRGIYNGDFRNFSPTPRTNSLRRPREQFHMYEE